MNITFIDLGTKLEVRVEDALGNSVSKYYDFESPIELEYFPNHYVVNASDWLKDNA